MSNAIPMTQVERLAVYYAQNRCRAFKENLTPAQRRRIRHKANRAQAQFAGRVRFLNGGEAK